MEIWQVGCRAVSKRDTSFSAWLRDNDEPQIRMNEKVLRNLSAMLRRPALSGPQRMQVWLHWRWSWKINALQIHFCTKMLDERKLKRKRCRKHVLRAWLRRPHLEAVKSHSRGTKEWIHYCIKGDLCLASAAAQPFKSRKGRKSSPFKR